MGDAMNWIATGAQVVLLVMVAVLALPAFVLLAQVLLAFLPARARKAEDTPRPRIAVLVPAHNESTGVLPTLAQIRAQLNPGDRVVVIADNCSDDTAEVARAAGAEVAERSNPVLRGKGYALDHGVRFLEADPPEIVIIIDADCALEPGCLEYLARDSHRHGCPVQGKFMTVAPDSSMKMRLAEFAMRVKAHVRPKGMAKLGLPCGLTGSGIAYPWPLISAADLASGHLAEDMQLGLELGRQGFPPIYCEDAGLETVFAASKDAQLTQRTRWEHGHLALLVGNGPKLLLSALLRGKWRFAAQVLDLLVPPLALLALLQLVGTAASLAAFLLLGWKWPLCFGVAGVVMLVAAVLLARARFAADIVSGLDLCRVPVYILAKLPMYVRFIFNRQVEWIRTKRDAG